MPAPDDLPNKPLPVAKKLPPRAPKPAPPPAPPVEDLGYEVVDEPPPRKKKRVVVDDDDDDRPHFRDPYDDEPKSRKRKIRKKRDIAMEDPEDDRDKHNAAVEWGLPLFLMFLGIVMMLAASIIASRRGGEEAVGAALMFIVTLVFTIVAIPITIVALMVIGMMVGIDYGPVVNAIRSLAAIMTFVNGIYFMGDTVGLFGSILAPLLGLLATFALFMTLFSLDIWETWVSLFCLNVLAYVLKTVFFLVIILALTRGKSINADPTGFNDAPPKWNNKQGGNMGQPPARDDDP